jgi:hypothetical protein
MDEAVKLVFDEGWSIAGAAEKAGVLRMTLSNRLAKQEPTKEPVLGRPPGAVQGR